MGGRPQSPQRISDTALPATQRDCLKRTAPHVFRCVGEWFRLYNIPTDRNPQRGSEGTFRREGLGGAEEVLNDSKIRVTGSSNGFEVDLSF